MTSKSKNAVRSFETEIEKSREESNWKKVVELAQQLKSRSSQHESLAYFLIGEGKLEGYLEDCPPVKENIEKAQRELAEAKAYLTLATDESGIKAGVALDAHLLLGKLNYACGAYEEALKHFKLAELDGLTEKELPIRSLRIVAESFAIKGMCLEEASVPGSSKFKQAEKEAEIAGVYALASRLTLVTLQRGARPPAHTQLAALLPRDHSKALHRYRELLSAVETPYTSAIRLTVARRLAETLSRGLARKDYQPPEKVPLPSQNSLSRRRDDHYSEGPWKPKKYSALNQFVPSNEMEERMLVILVGEALASRDAVLSQCGQFVVERGRAHAQASALADLLAAAAARAAPPSPLTECLERAMKFSFGCGHVWRQRALCAAAAAPPLSLDLPTHQPLAPGGAQYRAAQQACGIVRRAATLAPRDAALRLTAAPLYYSLDKFEEGIAMAEEAIAIEQRNNGPLLARSYLFAGIGHQLLAWKSRSRPARSSANSACLSLLVRAVGHDNNDYLAYYRLALYHLYAGDFNEAMEAARWCVQCDRGAAGGARLVCALLRRAPPAATPPAAAPPAARAAAPRAACPRAADLAAHLAPPPHMPQHAEDAIMFGKQWLAALYSTEGEAPAQALSDRDLGSPEEACPALSRARAHCWLYLARAELTLGRIHTATGCVSEAAALTPCSHLVLYTRGLIHAHQQEWEAAQSCFQNAVALEPTHLDSMLYLGVAQFRLGRAALGERALRLVAPRAAAHAPRARAWAELGRVLGARGEWGAAADAAAAALHALPAAGTYAYLHSTLL